MSEEGFLRRWSRLKTRGAEGMPAALPPLAQAAPHPPVQPRPAAPGEPRPLPTVDDVAALGADSDFSAFVSQGVDKAVQRLAMKKLFSDPHFGLMDGLDIYIDDYSKSEAIPAAMLASLSHARTVFGPQPQPGHESIEQIPEGPDPGLEGATDQPPPETQTDQPATEPASPGHTSIEQIDEAGERDESPTDEPPSEEQRGADSAPPSP